MFSRIIDRNTTLPVQRSQVFTTAANFQTCCGHPRAAGRAGDRQLQQDAGSLPPDRHPPGAAGHPADRGHVLHRRQRHRQRVRQGLGHGQASGDHPDPVPPTCPTRRSNRPCGTRNATPPRTRAARRAPRFAIEAEQLLYESKNAQRRLNREDKERIEGLRKQVEQAHAGHG